MICNGKKEESAIREGLLLNEKNYQLTQLYLSAKKQLPAFTFDDYISNQSNVVFYQLDEQPEGTTDKDYLNIRKWQTSRITDCITLEAGRFKDHLLASVCGDWDTQELFQKEMVHLKEVFDNGASLKTEQFIHGMSKLKGLSGLLLPDDRMDFQQSFASFTGGQKMNALLTPQFFDFAIHNIKARNATPMPLFGLSLYMYYRWLDDVSKERKLVTNTTDDSLFCLFEQAFKDGLKMGKIAINRFENVHREKHIKHKYYETLIMQEFGKLREKLNSLQHRDYFNMVEQKEKLKNCFVNDCLQSINIELLVNELRSAILINEMIAFLTEELSLIRHKPQPLVTDHFSKCDHMIDLICLMAPESALINRLWETMKNIREQVNNERMPVCFINESISIVYNDLFEEATNNFKQLIELQKTDNKGFFISTQLRNLKYMKHLYNMHDHSMDPYHTIMEELLNDELNNIHEMQCFKQVEISNLSDNNEISRNKPFSFGYRQGPKELKPILTAMDLKMNMLTNGTTVDDLMEVLTCKDLSKNKKVIYIGFTTIKFAYFRKKVEPWFSSFTPAQIEKSGIFISQNEEPIKAHVIYNSTAILWEDSNLIDSIFDADY